MASARWTEIRITADSKDLGTIDGENPFPDYDFTWDSRRNYMSRGGIAPRGTDPALVITAAEAASEFWRRTASKWPSAKMTVATITRTEPVVVSPHATVASWLLSAMGLAALQDVYDGSPGDSIDEDHPSETGL